MVFSGVGNIYCTAFSLLLYIQWGYFVSINAWSSTLKFLVNNISSNIFQVTTMFPNGRLWVWILVLFELLSQANGPKEDSATSILGISIFPLKVARPSIFIGTPSIFESLTLKQIYLYCKTIMILAGLPRARSARGTTTTTTTPKALFAWP